MDIVTRTRRSARRIVVAAAAAAALTIGGLFATAPAQAAVPSGSIGACFTQYYNGSGGALSFRDIALDAWVDGAWHQMRTLYTDRAGCISSVAVVPGYSWRFRVSLYENPYRLNGTSRWATVASGYFYDLGPVGVLVTR